MAELINKTDTLDQGRVKLNAAITDAEKAKDMSEQADGKATQALANSESTQTQLDTIVIEGDSSVEAAQARVDEKGESHPTLKARIDDGFSEVTEQLVDMSSDANDFILYTFFRSNSDHTTNLFISTDGANIKKINSNRLTPLNLRDPSITYFKGWFLIAYTDYGPHDFVVARSKNLVEWETIEISLGFYQNNYNKIWAPEWFVDEDRLYILLSNREGDDVPDIGNNIIHNFRPYLAECNDIETLAFNSPVAMDLEDSNKIDPCMIKHENEYWVFIKDEYDKNTESWKCTTIDGQYTKVSDNIIPLSYTEGASIVYYKGLFYLYGDSWGNDLGVTYYTTSTDLINWNIRKQLKTDERIRHGTALVVSDNNAKAVIKKYMTSNLAIPANNASKIMQLTSLAKNGVIGKLDVLDGTVYNVGGTEEVRIESFGNPSLAKKFYLHIASNSTAKIAISSGSGILGVPDNTVYDAAYGDGDTLIPFEWVEALGLFKPVGFNNKKFYDKQVAPKRLGWKRVNLTAGTYTNLDVEDGVVYNVIDTDVVTINGFLGGESNGSAVGFILSSMSSSAKITLNSGGDLAVPGGSFVIDVSNNRHDRIYKLIKVADSTFRLCL